MNGFDGYEKRPDECYYHSKEPRGPGKTPFARCHKDGHGDYSEQRLCGKCQLGVYGETPDQQVQRERYETAHPCLFCGEPAPGAFGSDCFYCGVPLARREDRGEEEESS